ncbi:33 kDa ribonucleoprotein, chloroplastic [Canna indica]|uniref:33 kDa ribonucleoprotein, chloroplastic n=1 Tax=Canna indica TaxID=4628 RepID=A0AAQ3QNZ9_9LILI|nr:33 kDa ribonucleoprotein, chloroplastic [Canna indica]
MATAASFVALHGFSALSSHSDASHRRLCDLPHHHLFPPSPRLSSRSGSLRLKTLLFLLPSLPLSSSRPTNSASLAASSYAGYSDEDSEQFEDEPPEEEEEEMEEEEEPVSNMSRVSSKSGYPPQQSARLYVGNIPFSMTPAQLAEVFSEAGTVETVEVVYDRVTERSRGFAFVTMASVEEANEAIRMFDGSQMGGRTVKVNVPEVPRGGEREVLEPRTRSQGFVDSPYKVYAGNLGWSVTSQALRDAFASRPGLLGAKVIFDRDTGRSRGFGFVSFASAEECQAAIEAMNGLEVEGRPLRLSVAEGRPSISSRQESRVEAEPQGNSLVEASA